MRRVITARYIREYEIWLEFDDGKSGVVDLRPELYGEIFEPLKDKQVFRAFKYGDESNTIHWDNGADFAPEFLYDAVKESNDKKGT